MMVKTPMRTLQVAAVSWVLEEGGRVREEGALGALTL